MMMVCSADRVSVQQGSGNGRVAWEVWRTDSLSVGQVESAIPDLLPEVAARVPIGRERLGFYAARLAAHTAVEQLVGSVPATLRFDQRCNRCGAAGHGAPTATLQSQGHVSISWSHSSRHVAAVAAYAPVGIDVESLDADRQPAPGLPDTVDRLSAWTRREALLKCGAIARTAFEAADPWAEQYRESLTTHTVLAGSCVYSVATAAPTRRTEG